MMRTVQLAAVCVAMLAASAGQVKAGVFTYSDLATFSTASGPLTLENFNSSSLGRFDFGTAYQFNGFAITTSANPSGSGPGAGIANNLNSSIDGSRRLTWGAETFGANGFGFGPEILLTFDTPVTSFGFDWRDNDPTDGYQLVVLGDAIGGGITETPYARATGIGFFGLVSDTPFSTVLLQQVQRGGFLNDMSMDNVRFSTAAVPEPSSLAIFGIGACVVGFGVNRRRKRESANLAAV